MLILPPTAILLSDRCHRLNDDGTDRRHILNIAKPSGAFVFLARPTYVENFAMLQNVSGNHGMTRLYIYNPQDQRFRESTRRRPSQENW